MDFKSLLQTMTSLNEAETKVTKTGKVHKGDYGTSYEAGDEGAKKQETTRGRGRPKKDADETGEVKKYDTKSVGDVFGGGKKPSKEIGTVSKKHSLKEYIESVEEAISEGETIEKKGGRVHKGSYGTSYEAGDEGVKKAQTQRGRGRPKKDADETGEVKKYDTKSLGNVFGGGKAPKKPVGKVSASNKLKESAQFEAIMEGMFGGVDHNATAEQLAKLARVIKSVQTPEQFAVAQKYAQRMSGTIMNRQHEKMGFGSGMKANIGVSRDIQADLKAKAAELGIEYKALEEEMDQIEIKPASQTNTQVIQQGNKTLGTVTNPQLANQIKQSIGKGEMTLNPDEEMQEGVVDWAKQKYNQNRFNATSAKIGAAKTPQERDALTTKARQFGQAANKAQVARTGDIRDNSNFGGSFADAQSINKQYQAEGKKPDFLDVDKDGDKKESFKKAVTDKSKKKVAESISLSESPETLQHIISKFKHEVKNFINGDELDSDLYEALFDYYSDVGAMPYGTAKGRTADPFEWVTQRFDQDVHDYVVDESSIQTHTQHGMDAKPSKLVAVDPKQAPTPFKVDPIQATTDRAINFISGLRKPSNPFSESKTMKDMQVESWTSQLDSLLNEGITVSSSQGQQGQPDSVSVTASDSDAQNLMQVLRSAGIGGFGGGAEQPQADVYGVISQGEEEPTGTGTEPEMSPSVVGDGDDMLSLMKKMSGISDAPAQATSDMGGQDYEDEEGEDVGALEPASDEEEEGSEEQSSEESDEEEQTDEGNAFTGKLKQTQQGGNFKMGDKSYKDTSAIEEEHDHDEEETCNECGGAMYEGHSCGEEQVEENFSNDAGGDAMGDAQLMQLKALLSVGNDLHKMKTSQAMGNPVRVTESKEMINEWKKLSGI